MASISRAERAGPVEANRSFVSHADMRTRRQHRHGLLNILAVAGVSGAKVGLITAHAHAFEATQHNNEIQAPGRQALQAPGKPDLVPSPARTNDPDGQLQRQLPSTQEPQHGQAAEIPPEDLYDLPNQQRALNVPPPTTPAPPPANVNQCNNHDTCDDAYCLDLDDHSHPPGFRCHCQKHGDEGQSDWGLQVVNYPDANGHNAYGRTQCACNSGLVTTTSVHQGRGDQVRCRLPDACDKGDANAGLTVKPRCEWGQCCKDDTSYTRHRDQHNNWVYTPRSGGHCGGCEGGTPCVTM